MSAAIVPTLRYADAPRMIDWLVDVLGLHKHMIVEDDAGGIAHAQLTLGRGMIMLGSARDDDFGSRQKAPSALGGFVSQSAYVIVTDVDGVCEKARAAGATITTEPDDAPYGGRFAAFTDPEGHLWNIGSYDPWADAAR